MDNNVLATQANKPTFQVKEGSNYKVILTFDREEIITFDQFQRLANAIFQTEAVFVTINYKIVQVKDIRMIEPTTDRTQKQREQDQVEAAERKKIEDRRNELAKIFNDFKIKKLNLAYGEGRWTTYLLPKMIKGSDKVVVSTDILKQISDDFTQKHPDIAAEIDLLSDQRTYP